MNRNARTQNQLDWHRTYETNDDSRRQDALEIVVSIITILMMAALAWLFCLATPDQRSAEADWFDAQCREKGVAQ